MENHLGKERSPYLKQHATNPVWWYPWGAEAFDKAEKENKLIFLSIGYSTCHWCHVMEHESFTQTDVAQVLNQDFVAIKLDREERPDVDALYMNILVGLSGHGGWPLNMILTPHREAFFGGTYYPKKNFIELLNEIQRVWKKSPEQIHGTGRKITEWLKVKDQNSSAGILSPNIFNVFYQDFLEGFDFEMGGRRGAAKFVPSYGLRLLMRYHLREPNSKSLEMLQKTLEVISRGGIYDHLAGGFHRYATDEAWLIPHFEKMLYDQSAMAQLYLEAYQLTNEKEYRLVLEETLEYVLRDLRSLEGAFFAAEDADSEGVEGTFYVWQYEEIEKSLKPAEFKKFCDTYAISLHGNFEHKNILELSPGQYRKNFTPEILSAQDKLFGRRLARERPLRDDKIIVSWNALFISVLAKCGVALNEPKYSAAAKQAMSFILDKMRKPSGELFHQCIEHTPSQEAVLDDYAFTIDALIELYQIDFEERYLVEALQLQEVQDRLFFDVEKKSYYAASGRDPFLIVREKTFMDNVTPSGNSMSVFNLFRLSDFFFNIDFRDKALELLQSFPKEVQIHPSEFVQALMAYDYVESKPKQIAISVQATSALAKDSVLKDMIDFARAGFKPHQILAVGDSKTSKLNLLKGRVNLDQLSTAYVCVEQNCQLPTNNLQHFKSLL